MKEIYELMDRFASSVITEMEVEYHGIKVSMKKNVNQSPGNLEEESYTATGEVYGFTKREQGVKKQEVTKPVSAEKDAQAIKAPLVGTFYRSPAPGEAPFVTTGQKVNKGDVVAIIEAMKMMNEIVADRDGIIEEILVEDETMVEYDQPLMVLI